MTPYLQDPDVTLYCGDALDVLHELPDESVHCIATSPPFYALRDYGVDGQIGLEETPDAWAAALVAVFREARRVLRKDGTLWVECGDSYAHNTATHPPQRGPAVEGRIHAELPEATGVRKADGAGIRPKNLIGTPWLLAFALRADGWWLRGCNIWAKPNCMPESAKDRCTTAHSYVFQLSKSARYWFDGDAISEPAAWERWGDQTVPKHGGTLTGAGWIPPRVKTKKPDGWDTREGGHGSIHQNGREQGAVNEIARDAKHPRSVWTIPTQGYPDAHFATWPEALARRIILAGCPADGVVLDPFVGSGTTCFVARKLGRRSVGIDLSAEYLALAAKRLQQQSLFALDNGAERPLASERTPEIPSRVKSGGKT